MDFYMDGHFILLMALDHLFGLWGIFFVFMLFMYICNIIR